MRWLLMAGLAVAFGCSDAESRKQPESSVAAADLLAEYKANEIGASRRYEGKRIRVTGKFRRADITFGDASIELSPGVVVFVEKESEGDAGRLQRGDEVTVDGTVRGLTMGSVVLAHGRLVR